MCNTHMMNYMYCEQIDSYDLSGNVFGNNHKEKNSNLLSFACLLVYAHKLHPVASTFELNF